jgi:VanZ family protein
LWRWTFVAAYMIAIFTASSISSVPGASRLNDKLVHGVVYAGMCGVLLWAWARGDGRRVRGRMAAVALIACLLFGYSDEFHRRFVPGRQYDLNDLLADGLGAAVAAGVLAVWGIISRGRTRPHGL